jgi:hypothetical protein
MAETTRKYLPWALGAALVIQFVWWNNKCPGVLKGLKGY